jgi:sodium-independent sulfate anion transporter 11
VTYAASDKGSSEPLIAVAEAADGGSRDPKAEARSRAREVTDIEAGTGGEVTPVASSALGAPGRLVPLYGVNRPFFHVDVETAVASTVRNLERRASDLSA